MSAASSPRRIGLVCDTYPLHGGRGGGIGTYVRGLATGIRELEGGAGADATLWASRPPRGEDPVAALGPVRTSPLPSHEALPRRPSQS